MVYPAFRVRPMFPLKAAYFCPLLPHVDGFPILRVLRVDLTPSPPSDDLRLVGSPYLVGGAERISQVPDASLHACHALRWTPADPREPHQGGSSAWASGSLTPSPSALSRLTGLYQAWGIAVSLAADVIPCVRFNYFVRLCFEPPR
jgi:hypothetical protein